MNLHTASERRAATMPSSLVVQLEGVSVQYRSPQEHIPSFKEYAIRWLRGEIRYHKFTALKDINLEVHAGEILGIIGPNGAGKSTLLKVIARVLRPTQGRVRICGRVSPLLELGAGFDAELTGRENVYLNSAILGFSKQDIDRRFNRIVEFAGLQEFIEAPLRTYSTGMAARLGFAVATDVRPEILIVDEILGVGDTEFQTKSFERIQSFQAEGATILLVTHSLQKVREMCSRVIWLDRGRLVLEGSAETVVDHYLYKARQAEGARLALEHESAAGFRRAGNRKVEIVGVRILGGDGRLQSIFQTGQTLRLEMDYVAHEPVESPIFGMAIHRNDGVHITGPNTRFAGEKLPRIRGRGTVIYTIPSLPLLEAKYHISVAVTDWDDTEMFDYHDQAYSFRVVNDGTQKERYGLVTLGGRWTFEGN